MTTQKNEQQEKDPRVWDYPVWKTIILKDSREIDLVKTKVWQLGFYDRDRLMDIYKCALIRGLELCPEEVGSILLEQYKDQPKDERLEIAMEPMYPDETKEHGTQRVYILVGGELSICSAFPYHVREFTEEFIFVKPRK